MAYVLLSASLFGVSMPVAKVLVGDLHPTALAGLLYLGAFLGLTVHSIGRRAHGTASEGYAPLGKADVPWLAGSVLAGGVVAPVSMLMGLALVSGFSASLLLNIEGVATATIAVLFFREHAGRRLWLALAFMTAGGVFLTWSPDRGHFGTAGPSLIVLAMAFWGLDNNLTRRISDKDPIEIVRVKGLVSGTISLSLAFVLGAGPSADPTVASALVLGAFGYGISLVLFVSALAGLGSSRTGALFGLAPFIGAVASLVLLRENMGWMMLPAAGLMAGGAWLLVSEDHSHVHIHGPVRHAHSHVHDDAHHLHRHHGRCRGPHVHEHTHLGSAHAHAHWPDTHHRHGHRQPRADKR